MKTPRYLRTRQPLPVESPDILHNGHRYRHDPFLPEHRPAATGRIQFESQLGNIQAAAPMPLTSPGNDDGTGGKPSAHTAEKHCRTRPTNIEAIHPCLQPHPTGNTSHHSHPSQTAKGPIVVMSDTHLSHSTHIGKCHAPIRIFAKSYRLFHVYLRTTKFKPRSNAIKKTVTCRYVQLNMPA